MAICIFPSEKEFFPVLGFLDVGLFIIFLLIYKNSLHKKKYALLLHVLEIFFPTLFF